MISFLLLAHVATADKDDVARRQTQSQVDKLAQICRADKYVRLEALSSRQVSVHFLSKPERTTPKSERAFGCLLSRLKAIRGLEFGFLGNEAELETEKN